MGILLSLLHGGVGAVWLGSMAYSLFVVQPRVARLLPAGATEDLYRELAAGNRWRVAGLIAVLALSGLGLVAVGAFVAAGAGHAPLWWSLVAAKTALLLAASALFWWVSWRGWPQRIFALPEELPALQRRFRAAAVTMCGLVGAGFALGIIAEHL